MKVLVTGGTGYVGTRLREMLKAAGHDVRLLVRLDSQNVLPDPASFEIVNGNVFNTNACLRACAGVDAVINLVGIIREFPAAGVTFEQYHSVAPMNLLSAAKTEGVTRFIHMSGLGASADATSQYHTSKAAGDELVQQSDMRWTIVRPSWIFAPGDNLSQQIMEMFEMPVVPLIDSGKSLMQPVSRDDVCEVLTRSLSMPETQSQNYDLGGPDRMTFADIVHRFASEAGKKIRTMNVPVWAIRPVVGFMQRYAFFPLTVDQLRMLREDNVCEIDRFVRTFRIEPKSFASAIPELVRGAKGASHGSTTRDRLVV